MGVMVDGTITAVRKDGFGSLQPESVHEMMQVRTVAYQFFIIEKLHLVTVTYGQSGPKKLYKCLWPSYNVSCFIIS